MAKPHSISSQDVRAQFERALRASVPEKIRLRLYVSGLTPKSTRAIADLRRLCQENLRGQCDVEIIDIYQQPERAIEAQVIAVPTLVKEAPEPLRRLIGSLKETSKVLKTLGFEA
jgi:circadian clock protein KaiB